MSFIPADELKPKITLNPAPMIDFLFLMVAFFACLAFSRLAQKSTDIELVTLHQESSQIATNADLEHQIIELHINQEGQYTWVTDIKDYPMENTSLITKELANQYQNGLLPKDKAKTHVLLKIDKATKWQPILEVLYALNEAGYDAHPLYEPAS